MISISVACVRMAVVVLLLAAPAVSEPQPCRPSIQMNTLLDGLSISRPGLLAFGKLYARCLPDPARASASQYGYNPYDGGRLSTGVRDAQGTELYTLVWYGEKIGSLWQLERFEVPGGPQAIRPLGVGDYTLEFALEGQTFQRLSFSVVCVGSADVYHPEPILVLDGPWRDYAELHFPNPDRYTQLWVWLRSTGKAEAQPAEHRIGLRLVREGDGAVLADASEYSSSTRLGPEWQGAKLSFRPLVGQADGSPEFHASNLLTRDGWYRIELTVDEAPWAAYRVEVAGGRFRRDPAEARAAADHLFGTVDELNHWSLTRQP